MHEAPSGLVPQLLLTQVAGDLHSPLPVHEVLQAVLPALHTYGVHEIADGVMQVPAPSHFPVPTPVLATGSQEAGLHSTLFHNRQAP